MLSLNLSSQDFKKNNYLRYLDSANYRTDNYPNIANKFLDSIPNPIEKNIKGRVSEFYHLKATISSHLNMQAEVYHYNILALKNAEKEKNYDVAGAASIELFYNLYIIKKDSTAFEYLKKAENFYNLTKDNYGHADVMQMKAFIEYYNANYKKSNDLILPDLNYFKSLKDDSFYYMYALFMLTSNYIHLGDDENSSKYFKIFKTLEKDTTISSLLFKKHEVTLNICMEDLYLDRKNLDKALFYLTTADSLRNYMNTSDTENHFKNYTTYFTYLNNIEKKNNYLDSLKLFNENELEKNINASFLLNENFIETNKILETETEKNYLKKNWIIFLLFLLIGVIVFGISRFKKIKKKINEFKNDKNDYAFLQKNHEKLKVKIKGLENYITDIKKEIKNISTITDIHLQKNKIVEFHKELHHNSSIILLKGEDHLDLINELNIDFFNQISSKHPELSSSEIIICYYLFMGFKNKEIGVFTNTSVRSVESKRFRISNKLKNKENQKDFNLINYLKETFKNTLSTS